MTNTCRNSVGMTGRGGGALAKMRVSSDETPRIQESNILLCHIICESVEQTLFASES